MQKWEKKEKMKNFSFSSSLLWNSFSFLYSSNKMAHTCTQKGIFSLFKGKIHTHTLFKRDNGALMDDRHEMMRNSYYTNQYLETIMDYYPREKVRKRLIWSMRISSLPVEFLQRLMVKIVNKEPMLVDIEFDWML